MHQIAGSDGAESDITVLTVEDIERLRLGWWSRFNASEVTRTLQRAPGLSVWSPGENEYLIAGPWRHRTEIIHAVELVAIRHSVALVQAAVERAHIHGKRLFLAIESSEKRQQAYYDRCGLTLLEEVIAYERGRERHPNQKPANDIERITVLDALALEDLRRIDHRAFPWLWQNDDAEFREYMDQPGVEIYLLRDGTAAIAYLGISIFPGWGHIDRVAVLPEYQGRGLGRKLTAFAISRMSAGGASTIGLSTQGRNLRSQALYEKLGFRRKVAGEYRIYGALLRESDSIEQLVMGY